MIGQPILTQPLHPLHQSQPVQVMFVIFTVQIAVEKKCARVHFAVLGWNKSSIDYYKRQGAIDLTEVEDWHLFRLTGSALEKMAAKSDGV